MPPAYNNGIELWFCKYLVSRIPIICEQHYKDYMCRCRAYKAQVLSSCLYFLLFRTFFRLYFYCSISPQLPLLICAHNILHIYKYFFRSVLEWWIVYLFFFLKWVALISLKKLSFCKIKLTMIVKLKLPLQILDVIELMKTGIKQDIMPHSSGMVWRISIAWKCDIFTSWWRVLFYIPKVLFRSIYAGN